MSYIIQTKELRLGNLVMVTFSQEEVGFGKDIIGTIAGIQKTKVLIEEDLRWHPIDSIKPIVLSEKMLIWLGFEKRQVQHVIINWLELEKFKAYYVHKSINDEDWFFELWHNDGGIVANELRYLHHFQNIVFEITRADHKITGASELGKVYLKNKSINKK